MPEDHAANGSSSSDDRGQAIDKATTSSVEKSTISDQSDDGKGQSDTGRADQTDGKEEKAGEAARAAFDPDEEQV